MRRKIYTLGLLITVLFSAINYRVGLNNAGRNGPQIQNMPAPSDANVDTGFGSENSITDPKASELNGVTNDGGISVPSNPNPSSPAPTLPPEQLDGIRNCEIAITLISNGGGARAQVEVREYSPSGYLIARLQNGTSSYVTQLSYLKGFGTSIVSLPNNYVRQFFIEVFSDSNFKAESKLCNQLVQVSQPS